MSYFRVPTTYEVYRQILDEHAKDKHEGARELSVFSSCTDHVGEFGRPHIFTSWGFSGADYPLVEARSTWDSYEQYLNDMQSGKFEYWLICVKDDEE